MNAIFFKEWIKTRWYLLLAFLVTNSFVVYAILRLQRVIELKGVSHLWEIMLTRNAIFVDLLMYIPVLAALVLALVQFMPEMYHKCLKLTLHLPYPQLKMVTYMVLYGFAVLTAIFAVNLLVLFIYLQHIMAVELYSHILLTVLPWYIAGLCAYSMMAWVCLEPTWKMRVFNLAVTLLILRIFFLSSEPEAYNVFWPWLLLYSVLAISLSWNSVRRFKCGKQD